MKKHSYPGEFIVIEGADGSGTTTQSEKLSEELGAHWTHEPSKNKIGEKVDEMISSGSYSPEAIALSFTADRMIHLEKEIIPRLKKGETVISDRYYHSTIVYQTVMGADKKWVKKINREVIEPDKTFILDVSAEEGMKRVESRGEKESLFEELSFQQKVVLGYRKLEQELEQDIQIVDASQNIEKVFQTIKKQLTETRT